MRPIKAITAFLTVLALFIAGCNPAASPTPRAAAPSPASSSGATAQLASPAATPKPAAAEPRYGGTLTGWDAIEPEHLDIQQANSGGTLWPVGAVYNGLIQHSPSPPHDIVPELAQSWDVSADGKTYTFTLTRGVTWHDGKPFTAEDVVFSLDRMRDPPKATVSPRKIIYAPIDKVEVVSADKVKINLQYASPSFLVALASGWTVMMPRHVIQARGDMKNDAVGTGAFKLKQYVAGTQVVLEKNKDYFVKGRPYLDGITWYMIRDSAVQFAAFRTKRALVTGYGSRGLNPAEVEIVKKEIPGVGVYEYSGGGSGQDLTFNVTKAPFSDVRVRRAAVMALDQSEVIKVALQGGGQLSGPLGPVGPWSLPEKELLTAPGVRKPTPADIAEAKKLLAEAGFPNGLKTGLAFRGSGNTEAQAQVVQGQLAQIGIDVTLQRMEAGLFQDTQRKRNWDVIQTSHPSIIDDPEGQLAFYVTGSTNNFSGFSDKTVDDLAAKQAQTINPEERKRLLNEIERRLIDQVPSFRLFEWTYYFAHWPDVKGYQGVGSGPMNNSRWTHVWLAQ